MASNALLTWRMASNANSGGEMKIKLKAGILRLYLSKCTTPCKMTDLHINIKLTIFLLPVSFKVKGEPQYFDSSDLQSVFA